MAEYIEYHPLKFWLDPASIAEIVAHIQTYLVNNPINSTTEIETIIHDYLIAHPEIIGGVRSINGETGEVVLTADNISGGENVTIKDVLDSLQDQIDDIVASIPSDYQQLINDVSDLKSNLQVNNNANLRDFIYNNKRIGTNGVVTDSTGYKCTDYIECDTMSQIIITDIYAGESTFAYSFYTDDKVLISGQNDILGDFYGVTIPANTAYVRFCGRFDDGYGSTHDTKAYVFNNIEVEQKAETNKNSISQLLSRVNTIESLFPILPNNTSFFDIFDFIDGAFIDFWGGLVGTDGKIWANTNAMSIKLKVEPNTTYVLEIPNANRSTGTSNATGVFETGQSYTTLSCTRSGDLITFTTGAGIYYAVVYFYSGTYDTSHGTDGIHLYKDSKKTSTIPTVKLENLPVEALKAPYPVDVLVFGDSITDTANITIDSETNCTTAYTIKNPNNSYVKDGVTIQYAMWPTLIQRVLNIRELRNYALAGAHFYTTSTPPANPRSKLLYQVQVALNDLANPNNVFPNDDFNPNIIIVACGINDGNIAAGSFETTMAKTVMKTGDVGVDVEATLAAMNQQNPMDAMRYVLMLLKQTFPTALLLYVNPLQQTYGTDEARQITRVELGKMAERYDFINLDGFAQFGVVRDFETQEQVGLLTKDGLHPNEKGQNLYARNIVQAIKRYYFPLDQFNP